MQMVINLLLDIAYLKYTKEVKHRQRFFAVTRHLRISLL